MMPTHLNKKDAIIGKMITIFQNLNRLPGHDEILDSLYAIAWFEGQPELYFGMNSANQVYDTLKEKIN